jgi:hypothetical protein
VAVAAWKSALARGSAVASALDQCVAALLAPCAAATSAPAVVAAACALDQCVAALLAPCAAATSAPAVVAAAQLRYRRELDVQLGEESTEQALGEPAAQVQQSVAPALERTNPALARASV